MSEYKNLLVETTGPVLVVKINRERALNALSSEVVDELQQLFEFHSTNSEIGCVIITGAGEKAFVAGADINELAELDIPSGTDLAAHGQQLMQTIQNFHKPVIAAVNGFALGGGTELALACDIRLVSEKAKFGQPEVNLGIFPGYGGTQRLSRLVGRGKAMQMILTGDMINAAEAYRIGLADEVYPPEELMEKAMAMAESICSKAPVAVALAKECINNGLDVNLAAGCDIEKDNFGKVCGTEDKNEGTHAFLEKRKPKFTGR